MVKKDDFIVHLRSFEGGLERANSDGIISPAYHTFHGENTDSRFYYPFFRSKQFIEVLLKPHIYGIRDGKSIDIEGMKNINLPVPSYEEQFKVGEHIEQIDKLITLHQRKLNNLKKVKKSMLEKMFPQNGEMEPQIRFCGFNSTWEQRKLSDITFLSGKKNKDNLPYKSYSITNENGFVPQDEKFENGGTMHEADKRMYYIVSPNSFTYNPARINVGSIGYQNTSDNVIVSSLYEVFKTTDDVDDRFLWHWVKSDNFQKLITQLQEGGVRLYFYYDKLCMGKIMLPNLDEQQRIGHCLDKLDNLITLHQRKLNKLKKVKKSMLEKMFPQNGEMEPQIRFCGFNSTWEQRKLGNIASKVKIKNSGMTYTETFTNSAEQGIISQRDYFDHDVSNAENIDGYYIVENNDFVYNPRISSSAPVGPINRNTLGRTGVMSPLYTVFRISDNDYVYMEWLFKSNSWHKFMFLNGDSGARADRFSIKDSIFFDMPILVPCIEEQKRVGEYLSTLDNLITLHQRKLEKLKKIKKAMLEKMFV